MQFETLSQAPRVVPVWVDGRIVAQICDGIFSKSIAGSKHLLKAPPAIALDADSYDGLRENFRTIKVTDRETGRTYVISADEFDRFKVQMDRGYGRQYFVPLGNWDIHPAGPRQLGFDLGDAA